MGTDVFIVQIRQSLGPVLSQLDPVSHIYTLLFFLNIILNSSPKSST